MKQVPFDLDKYFLRFDRKCVLHNLDEKLVSCSSMNWEKFVKTCFTQKSLSKIHFRNLLQFLLTYKNSLESKILEFNFNPHTSHKIAQAFTRTLLLSISKAQLRKWGLRGSKMGVYIVIIGEGKLKGHQINGSLPLGNIIVQLTLPQLIPHFGNLHWRMDNFVLPYRIELRFGR